MHMLSVAMEPVLHKSCPPNCQDMLAWLPNHVALHVLSFLDSGMLNNVFIVMFHHIDEIQSVIHL